MRLPVTILSLALLGPVACDGDDGVLPLDRYCEATSLACPGLVSCCEARGFEADGTTCEVAVTEDCHARLDEAAAVGASYDTEAGALCVDAYWAWVDRCDPEAPPPPRCDDVFTGPDAPGGLPGMGPPEEGLDAVCAALFAAE